MAYYGVSWNELNDTYVRTGALIGVATGSSPGDSVLPIQASMRRCILSDSGVVQYYLYSTDSTLKEDGITPANLDGSDGQVMVEIPAFYYRYDYIGTTHTWNIDTSSAGGYGLHPAFIKNGMPVSYRYIGAYEASLYDVSASIYTDGLQLTADSVTFTSITNTITRTAESHPFTRLQVGDKIAIAGTVNNNGTFTVASIGDQSITVSEAVIDETAAVTTIEVEKDWTNDKLCSISGKAPINRGTRDNFRTAAINRGIGWRQQDYDLISAVQLLYLIEYASFYSQSMIGNGFTDWSNSTWNGWNDLNPINNTGLTNSIGNVTGNLSNGNGIVGSYMSYRGVENLFGHLSKFVEGINLNGTTPYIISISGSSTWIMRHNFNDRPIISQYIDDSDESIIPENVDVSDVNMAIATFDGNIVAGYAPIIDGEYMYTQSISSTTWTINHLLNNQVLITQFFNTSYERIEPSSLVLNDKNTCTATFDTSIDGYAKIQGVGNIGTKDMMVMSCASSAGGYIKLGNGGSNTWKPEIENNVESSIFTSNKNITITEDNNYYYINVIIRDKEDINFTEIGFFDVSDNIIFYSYHSPFFKSENMNLNIYYRIRK